MGFFALHEGSGSRRVYNPVAEIRLDEKVMFQSYLECGRRAHQPQEMSLHKDHPLKVQTDRLDRMRFAGARLETPLRNR